MDAVRKESVDRYMSVPQAARILGRAHATILSMVLRGELEGMVVAGRTVVTRESVERVRAASEAA